jgi:hypothetical protein
MNILLKTRDEMIYNHGRLLNDNTLVHSPQNVLGLVRLLNYKTLVVPVHQLVVDLYRLLYLFLDENPILDPVLDPLLVVDLDPVLDPLLLKTLMICSCLQ